MTILITVVTVFFTQGGKIDHSLNPDQTYKAWLTTNELFNQKNSLNQEETEFSFEGFIVEKVIKSFNDTDLFLVTITLKLSDGKVVYTRKKYINTRIEI